MLPSATRWRAGAPDDHGSAHHRGCLNNEADGASDRSVELSWRGANLAIQMLTAAGPMWEGRIQPSAVNSARSRGEKAA